jgi:16S rRNA (adenine1518-N6/adenine1519-N6)-dimethyltransferase
MLYAKKSLGQNFLIDKNIIKKIINVAEINKKNIIEIGPGEGALTNEIISRNPKSLTIIEKDLNLVKKLKVKYSSIKFIKIYNADILKFDLEKIILKNTSIFGNLPYNISSQILVKILKFKKWPPNFYNLVFMFQKELGEKIIGKYQSKNFGRLSILSNYRLDIVKKFLVSPNCFSPKPKITSMVINFRPKNFTLFNIKNLSNLEKITNIFFSNRRKMINKNIKKILSTDNIKKLSSLRLESRPSEIKAEVYYKITELYEKQ